MRSSVFFSHAVSRNRLGHPKLYPWIEFRFPSNSPENLHMQKMSQLVRAIRVRKLVLVISLPHLAKISSQQPEVLYPTSCVLCSRCEGPSHRLSPPLTIDHSVFHCLEPNPFSLKQFCKIFTNRNKKSSQHRLCPHW